MYLLVIRGTKPGSYDLPRQLNAQIWERGFMPKQHETLKAQIGLVSSRSSVVLENCFPSYNGTNAAFLIRAQQKKKPLTSFYSSCWMLAVLFDLASVPTCIVCSSLYEMITYPLSVFAHSQSLSLVESWICRNGEKTKALRGDSSVRQTPPYLDTR